MSRTSLRRRAAVVGCTILLTAGTTVAAQPASAGSMSFSKSSGRLASVDWLEVGTLPAPVLGNFHFGNMQVEELSKGRANVFGSVTDVECPDGVVPGGPGGGHGVLHEPPPDNGCTVVGVRFIKAGSTTFTMDKKLNKATLTGILSVVGHDGPTAAPPVNMTWTGVGTAFTSEERGTFSDGSTTYTYRYSFTGRGAQVSGNIGPMVYDDEPGEYSSAQLGSYKTSSRQRTR